MLDKFIMPKLFLLMVGCFDYIGYTQESPRALSLTCIGPLDLIWLFGIEIYAIQLSHWRERDIGTSSGNGSSFQDA
jgi:hypothetical protein